MNDSTDETPSELVKEQNIHAYRRDLYDIYDLPLLKKLAWLSLLLAFIVPIGGISTILFVDNLLARRLLAIALFSGEVTGLIMGLVTYQRGALIRGTVATEGTLWIAAAAVILHLTALIPLLLLMIVLLELV